MEKKKRERKQRTLKCTCQYTNTWASQLKLDLGSSVGVLIDQSGSPCLHHALLEGRKGPNAVAEHFIDTRFNRKTKKTFVRRSSAFFYSSLNSSFLCSARRLRRNPMEGFFFFIYTLSFFLSCDILSGLLPSM